jgi:signal peptidase I
VNSLKEAKQKEGRFRLVREIIETIILTVVMFAIIHLAVQNYDVDGPSMEPSLHNNERIMVDKVSYLFHAPARGDVIVFVAPPQPTLNYVKRIIAEPGDVITIQGTTVIVNGVKLNEPYVHAGYDGNPYAPIINKTIPKNDYFVMGDDRKNSSDSRDWGFVPRQNIIGRAALVYWPLTAGNSGLLPDYSSVFAAVHSPKANSQSSASLPSGVVHAAPAPLDSTFGMSELLFCALPTGFLVCSKSRKKQ